jgi:hypothetical protein
MVHAVFMKRMLFLTLFLRTFTFYRLGFRHRNSWQDAGRIKINRADLVRFVYELAEQLKINYESPPPRRVTYNAGDLAHGEVESFKTNLLKSGNVICRAREVLMANAADGTATQRSSSLDVLEEEEPTAPLAQGE